MFFSFNFLLFQENQTETLENGTVIEYVDNVTVVNPCYLLRTDTTDDKVRIANRNVTTTSVTFISFNLCNGSYRHGV